MSLFDAMKGVQPATTEAERNELVVTEASHGIWDYHLSRRRNLLRSLCGTPTMPTAIPLSAWGKPVEENLPKAPKYCEACARVAWPQAEDSGQGATSSNPGHSS